MTVELTPEEAAFVRSVLSQLSFKVEALAEMQMAAAIVAKLATVRQTVGLAADGRGAVP
jgi:hypothetical protein